MRLIRTAIGTMAIAALPLAGSAFPFNPGAFDARLVGSDQPVAMRRVQDLKNDHLVITMNDGRRYWSWYILQYLLRPDQPARPREEIPAGNARRALGPDWQHVARVTMTAFDAPRMTCEFRYLGPPAGASQNGAGRCETTIGEVIAIRW